MTALRAVAPCDDVELALAAAAGSHAAFAALYERHARRLFARITRMIGPEADREDVLQKAFLQLHRALPRFRGESSVETFLGRITFNVVCDHLRWRRRRPMMYDDETLEAMIDGAPSPEERTRKREELRELFALLAHVKPIKRIAFVLVVVEGQSFEEVAEQMGAQPQAIKQRVLSVRRELLERMERVERRADRRER